VNYNDRYDVTGSARRPPQRHICFHNPMKHDQPVNGGCVLIMTVMPQPHPRRTAARSVCRTV